MIKDKLKNAQSYYAISENLKKGFEWLKNNDLKNLADGKYIIEDDDIFANIQSYETKDLAPYEAHRTYVDIQYMIKGEEKIGVTDYSNCITTKEYSKDKDIEFLENNNLETFQVLKEDEFLVFFPQDAHQPALDLNKKLNVKKVIVKVKL